jgi:post-segregation antitoxin (ccd killing protein)
MSSKLREKKVSRWQIGNKKSNTAEVEKDEL